jgi:hypothetical protein
MSGTMKRKFAALLVALVVLVLAGRASAEDIPRTFQLSVRGDTCITGESLREALSVALRRSGVHGVEVLVGASLGRARWRFVDAGGNVQRERTNTVTGDCGVLLRELSLSVTVAYETVQVTTPPPGCDAACRAEIRAEVRAELIKELRMDLHPVLLAGGMLSAGFTADPGGGFFVGGGIRFEEVFSVDLEARVLLPSPVVREPTGRRFDVTAITGALVPCVRWRVLLGCAFVDVGMLYADLPVYPGAPPPLVATIGVGPRLGVHVPFADRFAFRAFADLRFAPAPSVYTALDTGSRWESNVVSGLFGAGFSFE